MCPGAPSAWQTATTIRNTPTSPSAPVPRSPPLLSPTTYPDVGLAIPITGGSRPRRRGNIVGSVLAKLLEDIRARHYLLRHEKT